MKRRIGPFWRFGSLALCLVVNTGPLRGQIVPDASLPVNSTVTPEGKTFAISGGTSAGGNLFHSFSQFSVPSGSAAHFNSALDIQNILVRVTGGSISQIDGTLKANGTANLFLLNPSGIIFGPNASLNIGGSFVASTASAVKFAGGASFSAAGGESSKPVLTVSVPIGLQFGPKAGGILVRGSGHKVSFDSETQQIVRGDLSSGLQVLPGKTLALAGGNIALEGGNLIAPSGRIELVSVAGAGTVSLLPAPGAGPDISALQFSNFPALLGDIELSGGAHLNTSGEGGGDIQVTGARVKLAGGSLIEATTLGSKPGGTVAVAASESLEMAGATTGSEFPSSILAETEATGSAGDVRIATGRLRLRDGAQVSVSSVGEGSGGNLTVEATESVELAGVSAGGELPSGLFSQAQESGNAGNLTVATGRLQVLDGAQVSVLSYQSGKGGSLTVTATSVEAIGTAPDGLSPSGLFASNQGSGAAGNLTIVTDRLAVRDGAQISTATFGEGGGGNLTVRASESVEVKGTGTVAGREFPSILGTLNLGSGAAGNLTLSTRRLAVGDGAQVAASTLSTGKGGSLIVSASESIELAGSSPAGTLVSGLYARSRDAGDAGDLTAHAGTLTVRDGATVTVAGTASGNAGSLQLRANSVRLESGGTITAATASGEGGNIALLAQHLLLRGNSQISATAGTEGGAGNGGNIVINAQTIAALGNSDITANAFLGNGGNIQIATLGIFRDAGSDITASSQFGLAGVVQIKTPDANPTHALLALPEEVTDPAGLMTTACQVRGESRFTYTGAGGIPPNPYELLQHESVLMDLNTEYKAGEPSFAGKESGANGENFNPSPPMLVEATGWTTGARGEVILTAGDPAPHPFRPSLPCVRN